MLAVAEVGVASPSPGGARRRRKPHFLFGAKRGAALAPAGPYTINIRRPHPPSL
jgi:hypothetical protein